MARDRIKTYYVRSEPEYWQYNLDGKGVTIPVVVKERDFLWFKKIIAGPFHTFREAGDYVYNVLNGKLTKRQHKDIYGTKRPKA